MIDYITVGDNMWANEELIKASLEEEHGYYGYEMKLESAVHHYNSARQHFENTFPEYKDTPMFEYVNNLCLFGPLWDSARLG